MEVIDKLLAGLTHFNQRIVSLSEGKWHRISVCWEAVRVESSRGWVQVLSDGGIVAVGFIALVVQVVGEGWALLDTDT